MAAKFSKKYYKKFAEILKNNHADYEIVRDFANYFAQDNGNFQRSTFFNACGLEY